MFIILPGLLGQKPGNYLSEWFWSEFLRRFPSGRGCVCSHLQVWLRLEELPPWRFTDMPGKFLLAVGGGLSSPARGPLHRAAWMPLQNGWLLQGPVRGWGEGRTCMLRGATCFLWLRRGSHTSSFLSVIKTCLHRKGGELSLTSWRKKYQTIWECILKPSQTKRVATRVWLRGYFPVSWSRFVSPMDWCLWNNCIFSVGRFTKKYQHHSPHPG